MSESLPPNDGRGAIAAPSNRVLVLFMLVVVYTFNFIDRQIVGILAVPIKADLGLTDGQLGLMGGLAFALFYTGLGIPVAMLADRYSRTWIMTVALTVWSAMTAVCGALRLKLPSRAWPGIGYRLRLPGWSTPIWTTCDCWPTNSGRIGCSRANR